MLGAGWVGEAELDCVQRLAGKSLQGGPHRLRESPLTAAAPSIYGVADQGMPALGEMNPDLMGAAGGETAFHQRRHVLEDAQHAVAGESGFAAPAHHRHLLAVRRV